MHELAMTVYQIRDPNNINQYLRQELKNTFKSKNIKGALACNDSLSNPISKQYKSIYKQSKNKSKI